MSDTVTSPPDTSITPTPQDAVLTVANLCIGFDSEASHVSIVRDLSFHVGDGETVAIVGESGCGKSLTALAIMGLIDPPGRVTSGSVRLKGEELIGKSEIEFCKLRGQSVGMIFQEPMTSLNPVMPVGEQIAEVLRLHLGLGRAAAEKRVVELLNLVRIPAARERARQFPHELSGGMKQRVMIAMAIACDPKLLIADEPTTALDVTVQAQILKLLSDLQSELNMSVLLITHNLGVVAHNADRVLVMYAGEFAESADVISLFAKPQHPYTKALLGALPDPSRIGERLASIPGIVPTPERLPPGCRFVTRCRQHLDKCQSLKPVMTDVAPNHAVSCWLHEATP